MSPNFFLVISKTFLETSPKRNFFKIFKGRDMIFQSWWVEHIFARQSAFFSLGFRLPLLAPLKLLALQSYINF